MFCREVLLWNANQYPAKVMKKSVKKFASWRLSICRQLPNEGDLKENAEYHAARETQGYTQAKINQLKTKLSNCFIVERTDGPKDTVGFGSTVKVRDLSDDMEEAYELVGPGEEDYDGEVMKILTSSPIATAMLGKKVGDRIEVEIPRGKLRMEILGIE
jgi:transcription elongation factor GreA